MVSLCKLCKVPLKKKKKRVKLSDYHGIKLDQMGSKLTHRTPVCKFCVSLEDHELEIKNTPNVHSQDCKCDASYCSYLIISSVCVCRCFTNRSRLNHCLI